ncbi:MAG: DUF4272 domain-containing protein [Planctomycetaceae bacterium]
MSLLERRGPSADEVADRALVLYAFTRRAAIEYALGEFGDDPRRHAQAEAARAETDRWLDRESLVDALADVERRLFAAPSGSWPREAIADGMWRKESLAVLLWAIGALDALPPFGEEADQTALDAAVTAPGSVSSFRANARLRPAEELAGAWGEADAWFAATEGRTGEDATLASISAERLRALRWLRGDPGAVPA